MIPCRKVAATPQLRLRHVERLVLHVQRFTTVLNDHSCHLHVAVDNDMPAVQSVCAQ